MSANDLVSIRAFAKAEGCDEKQVRRAIANGTLKTTGGKLPLYLVGTWRKPNSRTVRKPKDVRADETPEEAAERIVYDEGRAPLSMTDALRLKENYLAKLKQLEYDQKSGEIARVSTMVKVIAAIGNSVKTRILAVPSEMAPLLAVLTSPAEIEAAAAKALNEALERLPTDLATAADELRKSIQDE